MKVKSNINVKYANSRYAKIAYKTLEVDNKGFVESKLNDTEIEFNINSDSLGSFLATADDLIVSEIIIEDILKDIE